MVFEVEEEEDMAVDRDVRELAVSTSVHIC